MTPRLSCSVLALLAITSLPSATFAQGAGRTPAPGPAGPAPGAPADEAVSAEPDPDAAEPADAARPAAGTQPDAGEPTDAGPAPSPAGTAAEDAAGAPPSQGPAAAPSAPVDQRPPAAHPAPWGPYRYAAPPAPPPNSSVAADAEEEVPAPRDLPHWLGAEIGVRNFLVWDDGFEPYSAEAVTLLAQFVVAATVIPLKFEPLTIGLVPEYNVGSRAQETRQQDLSLTMHRLALGVQADVAIIRHLHTFARVAPGAVYLHGSIHDSSAGNPLVADQWTWNLDTTVGLAVLLGTVGDRALPTAGFWIRAEYGYSFAGEAEMAYTPEEDEEDPRRFGAVDLPPVTPSGFVNRMTVGVSF